MTKTHDTKKPGLLVPLDFPCSNNQFVDFDVIGMDAVLSNSTLLNDVRAIALAGHMDVGEEIIAKLPNLEIIAKRGVGYETVDVEAATRAGVIVTNTPDVLTDEVADLTLGLLIATVRGIPQADRYVRAGNWALKPFPLSASLRGRHIGIVGLGRIGAAIARRIEAMDLKVSYFGRQRKLDVELDYFDDITGLAEACDVLILTVPGGEDTRNLIDASVMSALGSEGVLINVARGSVVDEEALIEALQSRTIGAAGLDVFSQEPKVSQALIDLDNVVLLPHVGSGTNTTRAAMGDFVFANLNNWFAGKGPITPVN